MSKFTDDRPAKNDVTASTVFYFEQNGINREFLSFYEETIRRQLVPYGDPEAYEKAPVDIWLRLELSGFTIWYAIEVKGRNFGHNNHLVTASTEGEILEVLKKETMQEVKRAGYTGIWAAPYNDGKIRIWNLNKLDLDALPMKDITKHKYTVIPDSEIITEPEYLLPHQASIIIDRLNGN